MTAPNITNSPLVYNGEIIHQRDEMLSLTDMWKAAGSPGARAPADWRALQSTTEFVDHVASILDAGNSGNELFKVARGGSGTSGRGGTLAHWQVGLAYAKYLSPEFHMWCNTVVRERMMGKLHDAHLPADIIEMLRRTDGISRMLSHKVTEMEKTNATLLATVSANTAALSAIASVVQPRHPVLIRHGKTAGQIWHAHGLPPIKITGWFGNRLAEVGCLMEGRAEVGQNAVRLFDPDKADLWMRNGGRLMAEKKIAERLGQGKLRLVPAPAAAGSEPSGVPGAP